MVTQDKLSPAPGSTKNRKRVGRGDGSNTGSYSGRGCKGQRARAGNRSNRGFEGGQLPLVRRLPRKRGFTNIFRVEFSVVNIGQLSVFEAGADVDPLVLKDLGLIKNLRRPVKILGVGEIKQAVTVKAHKFSASAKSKIEAAGGKAEEVEYAAKAGR